MVNAEMLTLEAKETQRSMRWRSDGDIMGKRQMDTPTPTKPKDV